jgi:hypothetical protein
MSCVNPLKAFQCFDKSIVFDEVRKHDIVRSLSLPCGQCVGCRLERSRQWAMRCMHEASLHENNCFITLTYDNTHLPSDGSLHYKDFQLFIKRLRKKFGFNRIRYYMAGEYGENFGRPHFHACIFGHDFHDKKLWKRTPSGSLLYRSKDLEVLWPFGYSSVGDVNFESAAYVARYIMKKITGKKAKDHYEEIDLESGEIVKREPEFNKMSLKPGIGAHWFKKFKNDVYPHDYVVVRGKKMKPPKAYDKWYKNDNPFEYDEILYKREINAKLNPDNHDPKRLDAKRQILESRLSLLKRNLT